MKSLNPESQFLHFCNNYKYPRLAKPKGSFDLSAGVEHGEISIFLKEILNIIKTKGISEVRIKHWPLAYSGGELVHETLIDFGFKKAMSDVNQHIAITQEDYKNRINKNERKKLNQCKRAGYHFKVLNSRWLPEVYDLVKNTRQRKGFPVSMSFEDLSMTFNALPDHYHLFGVYDEDRLIATSVSIRISKKILYNFYHADHIEYRSKSPLVLLNEGIYNYCRNAEIEILDLGISSVDGILNKGLYTFKENLGCTVSEKNTYVLNYESS